MKKSILYIASLMLAAASLAACDDDKAMPPMPIPGQGEEIPAANTTILELKEAFNDPAAFSYNHLIGEKADGSRYIISGTVVSSDESGNIYKNLMIEDASAGLTIAVDQTKLYQSYKIGQTLTIDCTGLYIGAYGNCMQLGGEPQEGRDQPGRVDEDIFTEHVWVSGIPAAVAPMVVTVAEINADREVNAEFLAMQSRYVKFENMEFEEPGEPLAVQGQSTSRYAVDAQGNRLQLYNSGQSTIWTNTLPSGTGSISGILSYYNRDWQLLIIDLDAFQGFSGSTAPVEPIFSESFGAGQGDFTIDNVVLPDALSYIWSADSRYSCMKASAYLSRDYVSDSYLISPEIDLAGYTTVTASFMQALNYFSSIEAAAQEATFEVSVDGGQWEAVAIPHYPSSLSWTFTSTGQIDLTKYAGRKVRVAFHYTSGSKAGTWEVKDLKINGTK